MQLTTVLPSKIRQLRIAKGLKQRELAERADTTEATISKLERSNRGLSVSWVERLAKALDVEPQELMFGVDVTLRVSQVPIVGKIAAGNWREAVLDPVGYVGAANVAPDAFALIPDGDSMNKVLPTGAVVIIDPNRRDLHDGKIYAIMNSEGETTLKRFRSVVGAARFEPCSTNPEHQIIAAGEDPFTVLGMAVHAVTDL